MPLRPPVTVTACSIIIEVSSVGVSHWLFLTALNTTGMACSNCSAGVVGTKALESRARWY